MEGEVWRRRKETRFLVSYIQIFEELACRNRTKFIQYPQEGELCDRQIDIITK